MYGSLASSSSSSSSPSSSSSSSSSSSASDFWANLRSISRALRTSFFTHDLEHLMLLERLARHVQRQIITIHNTAKEVQVARHQVLEFIGNKYLPDVQSELGVLVVVGVVHVEGHLARHEENGLELDFALGLEVDPRRRVGRVLAERLVEAFIFIIFHLRRVARPDGGLRVYLRPVPVRHGGGARGFLFVLVLVVLLVEVLVVLLLVVEILFFLIFDLHRFRAGFVEVDREGYELTVSQYQFL